MKINGIDTTSISKINGIAIGSISKFAGVAIPAAGDADATAFFTATGITDATQQSAINNLVASLKSNSIWSKLNAIYPFVGGTATTHKYNLKNPLNTNAAFRLDFYGGVTHTSAGLVGDGINGYADTYFTPSTNFVSIDNCSYGVNVSTTAEETAVIGSVTTSDYGHQIFPRYGGSIYASVSTFYSSTANASSIGFYIGTRSSSVSAILYKNNSTILTFGNSTDQNTNPFILLARRSGTDAQLSTAGTINFAFFGEGLDATEVGNLTTINSTYQTALSR